MSTERLLLGADTPLGVNVDGDGAQEDATERMPLVACGEVSSVDTVVYPPLTVSGLLLLLLCVVFVLNTADRQLFSTLAPGAIRCNATTHRNAFNSTDCISLTGVEQGWIFGAGFALPFTLGGVVVSYLGGKVAREYMLAGGLLFFSLATLSVRFVQTFWEIMAVRVIQAMFQATTNPNACKSSSSIVALPVTLSHRQPVVRDVPGSESLSCVFYLLTRDLYW